MIRERVALDYATTTSKRTAKTERGRCRRSISAF